MSGELFESKDGRHRPLVTIHEAFGDLPPESKIKIMDQAVDAANASINSAAVEEPASEPLFLDSEEAEIPSDEETD